MTQATRPLAHAAHSAPDSLTRKALDTATYDRVFHVAVSLSVVHTAVMALLPRSAFLAHTVADDAFYYLEIARRMAATGVPTFDGLHVTTGIHPLWFALLTALSKVVPDDPWLVVRGTVALSGALSIGWAWALRRLLTKPLGLGPATVGASFLAVAAGVQRLGLLGMESSLAALLMLLFLHALFVDRRPVIAGLLGGLAILARLDMGIVVAVALIASLVVSRGREFGRLVITGAVAVVGVSPFFIWLRAVSGHAATTSATMKATVVRLDAEHLYGGRFTTGYLSWAVRSTIDSVMSVAKVIVGSIVRGAAALVTGDLPAEESVSRSIIAVIGITLVVGLVSWFASASHRRIVASSSKRSAPIVAVMVVASMLHLVVTNLVIPGQSDRWYWGLEAVTAGALIAWLYSLGRRYSQAAATFTTASAAGMVFLLAGVMMGLSSGAIEHHRSFGMATATLASDLDAIVPEGEKIGSCNAGGLEWFSRRGIVNLDGLVNDFSFIEARSRGEVRSWIARENIEWFVDCVPRDRQAGYANALGLRAREIEVVHTIDGGRCEGLVWRLTLDEAR